MELSLPGLIGCFVGVAIGVINYGVLIGFVEKRLRALDASANAAERESFERKLSLMRRLILGGDILLFGGVGYWFGKMIGG